MLRLYIDTASREAAEPLLATGVFHGLTTNPTLLQRHSVRSDSLPDFYRWATSAGAREVFFQATGYRTDDLIKSAEALGSIGSDVVVKLPATPAGLSAAASIRGLGHPVLITAVYNAAQALLAAAAKAQYVAPYLGRMDDAGRNGLEEVLTMQRALTALGSDTQILVASLRDVETVVALAQHGVSCFALAPHVAQQLFDEPLTAEAVRVFEAAAQEIAG